MKKQRYSLTLQISSLFFILTTIVGLILIRISYVHVQELLRATAQELSLENSRYIETEFKQKTAPILTVLDLLAYSSFVNQNDHTVKDKPWLASLELIFQKYPHLVGLYFADDNGTFTMIRPLSNPKTRAFFSAPDNAVLFVNTTHINGRNNTYFLNNRYEPVNVQITLDNQFDPRTRPWFKQAQLDGEQRLTEPYLFHFLKEIGFTLSRRTADGKKVVAADFTIRSISEEIQNLGFSPNSHIMVFDQKFNLIAQKYLSAGAPSETSQPILTAKEQGILGPVLNRISSQTIAATSVYQDQRWSLTLTPINLSSQVSLMLAEATPEKDLLANLITLRNTQLVTIGILLVIGLIIVWIVATRIARPLNTLIQLSNNIARFEFKKTRYPKSIIREVSGLTHSLQLMEHTLHDLLTLLHKTASNTDFKALAQTITRQAYLVTKAETIILYVYQDDHLVPVANHAIIPFKIDLDQLLNDTAWLQAQLKFGETVHISQSDNLIKPYRDVLYNSDLYLFPLLDKHRNLVGILNLGYERTVTQAQLEKHAFLHEILRFAQLAKENLDKIAQQKAMMHSFVELMASAIDTKSPYSGRHCQHVPLLCQWLVQAANDDDHYFPRFKLSQENWEELNMAAWLHDCGKITTPEFVIDKATKLETIYDRIHEIRMRFELLKAYEQTDYWKARYDGQSHDAADQTRAKHLHQLDTEFAFVAKCNLGDTPLSDDDISELQRIAEKTWTRTLNDQLGVSWMEQQRAGAPASLPVTEKLLDDKPLHRIPWEPDDNTSSPPSSAFALQPGQLRYHRGELYNLSIREGTLTAEERFIINDHSTQTIAMLNQIPFPDHLRHVPDIAGNHHERMDGHGYPRSLTDDDLSIQSRAMAIADVFEALTAKDRPYKRAKSFDMVMDIMTNMATTGHLDPKLYLLFLEKDIFAQYARHFFTAGQSFDFDKQPHIQQVKQYMKQQF